jgi:hypothetical protein
VAQEDHCNKILALFTPLSIKSRVPKFKELEVLLTIPIQEKFVIGGSTQQFFSFCVYMSELPQYSIRAIF